MKQKYKDAILKIILENYSCKKLQCWIHIKLFFINSRQVVSLTTQWGISERVLNQATTIWDSDHHKDLTMYMYSTLLTFMELTGLSNTKLRETLTSSLTVTSCLRMISRNGDSEQLIIFIKYSADFIDLTMDGLVHWLVTPHSASSCSTKHSFGRFTSSFSHLLHLQESEIRVPNQPLMRFGFLIRSSRMKNWTSCSLLRLTMFLIMIKSLIKVETILTSQSTELQLQSSSTQIPTAQLEDTSLEMLKQVPWWLYISRQCHSQIINTITLSHTWYMTCTLKYHTMASTLLSILSRLKKSSRQKESLSCGIERSNLLSFLYLT